MREVVFGETVDLGGRGLRDRRCRRVVATLERRRCCAELVEPRRRPRDQRHGKTAHDAGGDVRGHPPSDQVIGDVAVEQRAQHALRVQRQTRLQAEHGVHRDRVRRDDGRNQRRAVGRAGDVAIGQPRTIDAGAAAEARAHGRRVSMPSGGRHVDAKRREVTALDHGQGAGRGTSFAQAIAVVGGIELAAEVTCQPCSSDSEGCARLSASTRRRSCWRGQIRDGQPRPRQLLDQTRRQRHLGRSFKAAGSLTPKRQRIARRLAVPRSR